MSKQKNKDNAPSLEEFSPESFFEAIHVFSVIKDVTKSVLSTTQLYTDNTYEYILKRVSDSLNSKVKLESSNIFGITLEEFNRATSNLQFNPRLTTILSLSYNLRQPFDYEKCALSLPLSITTLALLHNLSTQP